MRPRFGVTVIAGGGVGSLTGVCLRRPLVADVGCGGGGGGGACGVAERLENEKETKYNSEIYS